MDIDMDKFIELNNLKNKLIENIKDYLKDYDWYELVDVVGNPEIDVEASEKLEEEIRKAVEENDLAISDYFIEQIEEAKDTKQKEKARDILIIFWKCISIGQNIIL